LKKFFVLTAAALAFTALPAQASAKERGCAYRLASLTEAEGAVAQARSRGIRIAEAQAQLARARATAHDEGCFAPRTPPRIEPIRYDGRRDDRWSHDARSPRARFERLIDIGYRRGLTRDEFRELEQLRKRLR
jgi:hypothetical protein